MKWVNAGETVWAFRMWMSVGIWEIQSQTQADARSARKLFILTQSLCFFLDKIPCRHIDLDLICSLWTNTRMNSCKHNHHVSEHFIMDTTEAVSDIFENNFINSENYEHICMLFKWGTLVSSCIKTIGICLHFNFWQPFLESSAYMHFHWGDLSVLISHFPHSCICLPIASWNIQASSSIWCTLQTIRKTCALFLVNVFEWLSL